MRSHEQQALCGRVHDGSGEANTCYVNRRPRNVRTQENWLYLCVVGSLLERRGGLVNEPLPDRQRVLQVGLMALWQCQGKSRSSCIRIAAAGCAVGSCADNPAAESFFGVLKRERIYGR